MSRNILIMMAVVTFLGCKKEYDVQPTYASLQLANTWAQNQPYYSPHPQIYIDSTGIWKPFISFSFVRVEFLKYDTGLKVLLECNF